MPVYYFEDATNFKRNSCTLINDGGPAYNAVLKVEFSGEATEEPVTLQEAKDWCRVDISDDDAIIIALIKAARIRLEKYANRSFITRTVTATFINGLGGINLPYGPIIDEVTYTDSEDNEIADYDLKDGSSGEITAVYQAGYEELPEDFITAIKAQVCFMLQNRGDEMLKSGIAELAELILYPIRIV